VLSAIQQSNTVCTVTAKVVVDTCSWLWRW